MKSDKHEIEHFTHLEHIWWGALTPAGQKRYDNKAYHFKRKVNPKKNEKILEVGCGDGEFTKRLIKVVGSDVKVFATDITPSVIARGKKKIKKKNLTLKVDNLHQMSFANGYFDVVCGISILHHVNLKKSLSEIYRVLKKGGKIFFTEPNLLNPHIYLGLHVDSLREKMEFSPDETAFKRWELEDALKKTGFKKVAVKNYDFLHPNTPPALIGTVEKIGMIFEKTPFIKEISGSLLVYAEK